MVVTNLDSELSLHPNVSWQRQLTNVGPREGEREEGEGVHVIVEVFYVHVVVGDPYPMTLLCYPIVYSYMYVVMNIIIHE